MRPVEGARISSNVNALLPPVFGVCRSGRIAARAANTTDTHRSVRLRAWLLNARAVAPSARTPPIRNLTSPNPGQYLRGRLSSLRMPGSRSTARRSMSTTASPTSMTKPIRSTRCQSCFAEYRATTKMSSTDIPEESHKSSSHTLSTSLRRICNTPEVDAPTSQEFQARLLAPSPLPSLQRR